MALETFNYIDSLNTANPTATDNVSQGDDHLRGIKTTLKNTFPNVTGAVNATQAELNLLDGVTATTAELNKLDGVTATTAEINHTDGVTSNIQTQLDGKQATLGAGDITSTEIASGAVSADELNVTGNGTAGQLLTSDGDGSMTWADAAAGGKVLQVVNTTNTASHSTTSTSFQTAFSVNITPSSTSSKILVLASIDGSHYDNTDSNNSTHYAIFRDSTSILDRNSSHYDYGGGGSSIRFPHDMFYLDSPATTSQVTYHVKWRNVNAVNAYINDSSGTSSITVLEIGA